MLGYLLARDGVPVTVLEKHADFLRDFRGDTVHPSTLQILHELGLLDDFLALPHQRVTSAGGVYGDFAFQAPDFSHVRAHSKFVALMPQWEFLNFLSARARRFSSFDLRMQHEAVDLLHDAGRITGVIARCPGGETVRIAANLVVGCDGRHSVTTRAGGLETIEFGVPIDVLWFRLSRHPQDPEEVLGIVNYGKALILINRGDYFQAGLIIRKGSLDQIKSRGLDAFRDELVRLAPYFRDRVHELRDWDHVKLLTVRINRLRRWYRPGLLCIGDAAHAMSPAGGVGINLAIQDAVAAANRLAEPLLHRDVSESILAAIERRREFPTRVTQAVQLRIHNLFARVFDNPGPLRAPRAFRIAVRIPGIHRLLGSAVGMGVRPEHIRCAKVPLPLRALAAAAALAGAAFLLYRKWSRTRVLG